MAIANRLRWYLDRQGFDYQLVPHPHSSTSWETARATGIPANAVAKAVLLEDERGYLAAVVPGSRRVDLDALRRQLRRDLELASERELEDLFPDCERGAVPPVTAPYRVPTVYDDALRGLLEVYFEAGDHEDVVHMKGRDFLALLAGSPHGSFSRSA